MLDARRVRIQVPLDAAQQLAEVPDLRRDDDTAMRTAATLSLTIEAGKVALVEGQDGSAVECCVGELLLIGNALTCSAGLLATLGVVTAIAERGGESPRNMLIGEESNP